LPVPAAIMLARGRDGREKKKGRPICQVKSSKGGNVGRGEDRKKGGKVQSARGKVDK